MGDRLPSFSLRPLDKNFVGAKPIEHAPESVFLDLEKQDRLIIERKRNGNAAYIPIAHSSRQVEIYSRGIHNLTAHFPALVEELQSIGFPKETMPAAELVVQVNGVDSPEALGQIARSRPKKARDLQESGIHVELILFNMIVFKGKPVVALPYADRLDILRTLLSKHRGPSVRVVEECQGGFEAARQKSNAQNWEGLVLYDAKAPSLYRLDGRIDLVPRPLGCWKWKNYQESDFVATGWQPSDAASHRGQVKDLFISQYDPQTRKLVSWGKVGIGLSAQQRREYTDNSLYPMVFEIKFERRTPKNRLILARIMRRRFDKSPEECFSP